MASSEQHMKGDIAEFAVQMKKMVNCRDHSDLKFLIGPNRKTVYAHRCILASRCAVFKAMFAEQAQNPKSGDRDVPLVLSDMAPEVFLAMLEFIYTNCVTLSSKTAADVLATALEYGLDDLQKLCCDYLMGHLTVSNACDIMQAAVTFGQDEMKGQALAFIEQNTANVFKSKSFQEMSSESLSTILQSDNLTMDELDIYRAVKEWATVNSVVLGKHVSEVGEGVVQYVRFPLLSPEELATLENENKKDGFIPVNLFALAWRFHALKHADKGFPHTTRRNGTNPRETHKYLDA
ncbi:BTB/POZ domain-containing protein 19-like [Gigantopelta aegis]|uniref:BTB/POZ domain-containing protein 19-like n=1 Tax=Gigantopelta aegis TaxID=1735272 RepID=UPI001B88A43D|nr:BTB/POZ domain-containing protein 19-like [Gigantopelta aegis]